MPVKMPILVMAFLVCSAYATNEASSGQLTSMVTIKAMQHVFFRSESAHSASMASIMSNMSPQKAWQVLEKSNLTSPALIEMTSHLHSEKSNLRKAAPTGYAAVEGARKLLNDMIYESMAKYDAQIAECTGYYAQQCAAMEQCRGQISASNFLAAHSRSLILGAQGTINQCETDIPAMKQELKEHNGKCDDELKGARTRQQILAGDIQVMTDILKMTDCNSAFVQTEKLALLHCQDPCTKRSFVTFDHDGLKQKVSQLQSSVSQGLMQDTFKDLFEGIESMKSLDFSASDAQQTPHVNKTNFSNPIIPRTVVPANPCTNPWDAGAPTGRDIAKGKGKCTLSKSPHCHKLQERFLLIQSGIKDELENLLSEIAFMTESCKETADTHEKRIQDDNDRLLQGQEDLAEGTKKEATAGEDARQIAKANEELNTDLKKRMKTCSENYINYESELCALKKIRGELYKKLKGGYSAFFQDCIVGKWDPEECSKECSGGEQKLSRNVMTHPNKGAKCLPLSAVKKCNLQPCPINCRLKAWNGWSKCSAQCGGGVQQRLREVEVAMKYGGSPCDKTSQTRACNNQACEKDCELNSWTEWGMCSKDCDGGTRKRQKFISEQAEGEGKCPGRWSPERLQYKQCNRHRCVLAANATTKTCDDMLDVVLLIDGSGSLGQKGWDAEIKAANTFVDAFSGPRSQAQLSIVLYSGPTTWSGVYKCFAKNNRRVDMEETCKIKSVTHLTNDMAAVKQKLGKLVWPKGSTLTSLALLSAYSEFTIGRQDAKSVVVAITDGRPLSYGATQQASKFIRGKHTRLVWVPVTQWAPLWQIKKWATRKWNENVVSVEDFVALENPDVITHIIADICPRTALRAVFTPLR